MPESLLPERRRPVQSGPLASGLISGSLPTVREAQAALNTRGPWRWQLFISTSTLQLSPLLDRLLEPIACADLEARLRLGLQEVLVNAVCHGNGRDPSRILRIRRIECERWWVFQVQDQGQGVAPDCRHGHLPMDPGACAGRGLFLIHHCFDDVRWSARGNRLQVAVRRQRP